MNVSFGKPLEKEGEKNKKKSKKETAKRKKCSKSNRTEYEEKKQLNMRYSNMSTNTERLTADNKI